MSNVLIFQPYLSNRPTSSGTLERQFRFLKRSKIKKVFALLTEEEKDYAKILEQSGWITPLTINLNYIEQQIEELDRTYDFTELYITRTYFTPVKQENIEILRDFNSTVEDYKYKRDYIPIAFSKRGVHVSHLIYDPLELQYDDLIYSNRYTKFSSMVNVDGATPHCFADLGYYDKDFKVPNKEYLFTFGGTSMSQERTDLLLSIQKAVELLKGTNVFLRVPNFDNLVDNSIYEDLVSKSLFTYTIPSQNPKYMSFTRMLLALSQDTMPMVHPANNLDCLFGPGFEFRDTTLRDFITDLICPLDSLADLLSDEVRSSRRYHELLDHWHSTKYYQWLQENL